MALIDGTSPDLIISGGGTRKIHQMTLETYAACKQADVITGIFTDELYLAMVNRLFDADVLNFNELYNRYEESRGDAFYQDILSTFILASADDTMVVKLGSGHPTMQNSTTILTKILADNCWDLDVKVFPGISASDSVLAGMGIEPTGEGIQHHYIAEAVNYDKTLEPDSYFYGWVFSYLHYLTTEDGQTEQERLVEYLTQFYPEDRTCYLVQAPVSPFDSFDIQEYEVRDLEFIDYEKYIGYSLLVTPDVDHDKMRLENFRTMISDEQLENLRSGDPSIDDVTEEPISIDVSDDAEKVVSMCESLYTDYDFLMDAMSDKHEILAEIDEGVINAVDEERIDKRELENIVSNGDGYAIEKVLREVINVK